MHRSLGCLHLLVRAHRCQHALGLGCHGEALPARLGLLKQSVDHRQGPPFILEPAHLPDPAAPLPEAPLQDIGRPNPLSVGHREPVGGPAGFQVPMETVHRRGEALLIGALKHG